jgi:hypothetical protein
MRGPIPGRCGRFRLRSANGFGALLQLAGLRLLRELPKVLRVIFQRSRQRQAFLSQRFFLHRNQARVDGLRFRILSFHRVHRGERVQRGANLGTVRPE